MPSESEETAGTDHPADDAPDDESEDEGTDYGTTAVSADGDTDQREVGTDPARTQPGEDEVFCRDCGAVIREDAEICPTCGVRQQDPPSNAVESLLDDLTEGGNPFVAAAASVVLPGLGQIYNRELQKGILVMVASFIALASVLAFVGIILYPAVWLYAIYDAYKVADRQSAEESEADALA